LKRTTELALRFVPLTVSVKAAVPAVLLVGLRLVIVGDGLLTVRVRACEVPPLGVGLKTVILNVPPTAMSAAGICVVNDVALTNVVVRLLPFKRMTELALKFVPVAVNVNAEPPAVRLVGLILLSVGEGLFTVRLMALDVPPAGVGLNTVIGKVPPTAVSADVI
jgi:hypothetical protein